MTKGFVTSRADQNWIGQNSPPVVLKNAVLDRCPPLALSGLCQTCDRQRSLFRDCGRSGRGDE